MVHEDMFSLTRIEYSILKPNSGKINYYIFIDCLLNILF